MRTLEIKIACFAVSILSASCGGWKTIQEEFKKGFSASVPSQSDLKSQMEKSKNDSLETSDKGEVLIVAEPIFDWLTLPSPSVAPSEATTSMPLASLEVTINKIYGRRSLEQGKWVKLYEAKSDGDAFDLIGGGAHMMVSADVGIYGVLMVEFKPQAGFSVRSDGCARDAFTMNQEALRGIMVSPPVARRYGQDLAQSWSVANVPLSQFDDGVSALQFWLLASPLIIKSTEAMTMSLTVSPNSPALKAASCDGIGSKFPFAAGSKRNLFDFFSGAYVYPDEYLGGAKPDLEGTWTSACGVFYPEIDTRQKISYKFKKNSVTQRTTFFMSSDTTCATPIFDAVIENSFELGDPSLDVAGAFDVNYLRLHSEGVVKAESLVSIFESIEMCDYTVWANEVRNDIGGKTCFGGASFENDGTTIYNLIKIEQDNLFIGRDRESYVDGSTPERRPFELDVLRILTKE